MPWRISVVTLSGGRTRIPVTAVTDLDGLVQPDRGYVSLSLTHLGGAPIPGLFAAFCKLLEDLVVYEVVLNGMSHLEEHPDLKPNRHLRALTVIDCKFTHGDWAYLAGFLNKKEYASLTVMDSVLPVEALGKIELTAIHLDGAEFEPALFLAFLKRQGTLTVLAIKNCNTLKGSEIIRTIARVWQQIIELNLEGTELEGVRLQPSSQLRVLRGAGNGWKGFPCLVAFSP